MSKTGDIVFHLIDDNDIDIAVNTKLLQLSNLGKSIYSYNSASPFIQLVLDEDIRFRDSTPIILLDIMMPHITGFDCLEALEKIDNPTAKKLKVYMLSSSIDRNDIRRGESFPMVQKILEKPLDIYLLKTLLENL